MALDPDVWGTVSDWVVAVTAGAGVGFGLIQLRSLKAAQEQAAREAEAASRDNTAQLEAATRESAAQVQIARAHLLLEIDGQFESDSMQASRISIRAMRNTVHEKLDVQNGSRQQTREQQQLEQAKLFSAEMNSLWARSKGIDTVEAAKETSTKSVLLEKYNQLMRLVNWIETVGFLCRRDLLPTSDVVDLYDAAIIPTIRNMLEHLQHRREEGPYPNPEFHRNAEWLYDRAVDHQRKREEPKPVPPSSKSNLNWG